MNKIDQLDKQILRLIAEDARIPFLEVARLCNVSGAAIHQRIQKLSAMGVLRGSQFVIDPEKIGYETCAYIGLNLKDPGTFDEVVEKLKEIPEVVECHYTTGNFDMFIKYFRTDFIFFFFRKRKKIFMQIKRPKRYLFISFLS